MSAMSDSVHTFSISDAGHTGSGEFQLLTHRINSFNARGCGLVFGCLAGFTLVVAVVFAALGAWLILPFAGLESMALYVAYCWVSRHANDFESLLIRGDVVALAVRDEATVQRYEFNRVWARLVVEGRPRSLRLALRSQGREVEVGRYLDSDGRQALARELQSRLAMR